MSQEHVEIARRGYAAINQRGVEALAEFIDPAIEWEVVSDGPTLSFSGAAAVLEFARVWFDSYNWLRLDPEELIELEDHRVLALVHQHGQLIEGSVPLEQAIAHVLTFRNGKCIQLRGFAQREEALQAVGLSE
jgi:ketosteroid isomerase-like protein